MAWTHLFGIKKWVFHERNFAVGTSGNRLLADTALDPKNLGITFSVHWLLVAVVVEKCERPRRINQLVSSDTSEAVIVLLFTKEVERVLCWLHTHSAGGSRS